MIPKLKKSRQKMGRYHENQAARELNKHLTSLEAWVVPGSGNQAHRDGGVNPGKVGDVQIKAERGRIVESIEVKSADPMRQKGEIRIAEMNRWRVGRRILMCKHDLGEFLCSIPIEVWSFFISRLLTPSMPLAEITRGARGATINKALAYQKQYACGGIGAIRWGEAVYMDPQTLCALLEEAHGEGTE